MISSRLLRPGLVMVSLCALVLVVLGDVGTPVRPLVAAWFLLMAPGLALAPLLRLPDGWGELTVVLALSVALDIVVAASVMYAGAWSPVLATALLGGISVVGALLQLRPRAKVA